MNIQRALVAMALASLVLPVRAQTAEEIVKWSASVPVKRSLRPKESIKAELKARIERGWHLYAIAKESGVGPFGVQFELPSAQPLKLSGTPTGSQAMTAYDPNFLMNTEYYEHSARFELPLVIGSDAKPGAIRTAIDVRFQTCNATLCLPPKTIHVPLALTIAAGNKRGK